MYRFYRPGILIMCLYLQNTKVTVGQFKEFIQEIKYITTAEKEDGTYAFTEEGYQKSRC